MTTVQDKKKLSKVLAFMTDKIIAKAGLKNSEEWEYIYDIEQKKIDALQYWPTSRRRNKDCVLVPIDDEVRVVLEKIFVRLSSE